MCDRISSSEERVCIMPSVLPAPMETDRRGIANAKFNLRWACGVQKIDLIQEKGDESSVFCYK
jgi:hypothetical protein